MAMMGLELTGKSPFEVIYLHGLVRAADGSKMSKTKGNVVDPLETVATYGADSLRYSLITGVTPGQVSYGPSVSLDFINNCHESKYIYHYFTMIFCEGYSTKHGEN